jgi:phytoene desaturase
MPAKKALIIGAGIAGIATAIRLSAKGCAVEIFEANDYPGGKLAEIKQDGFRFDAGPSLLTMPQYIDELFALTGKDPAKFFSYQKVDVICKYFYEDGSRLMGYADEEKFINEVDQLTGEGKAIQRYITKSGRIYELTDHLFLQRSLDKLKTFFTWGAFKSLLHFGEIDTFRTMHQANSQFFEDKRLQQYGDRYATYNGSNPYQAPATLNVIPHLEQHFGAYFPNGGMYQITNCLVELAESLGVKFHYRSKVDKINLKDKKTVGISINGAVVDGDIVISNMDVWFTYHKLLSEFPQYRPKKVLEQERSSSALIFYWGIKSEFPELDLHNIFFSSDYQNEFEHIWKKQTIYSDPTVYINITSKFKPDDAPPGCENWFVMINVPANKEQDWDQLITDVKVNILKKLSRILKINVGELIISESILDPRSIESRTLSYRGSIYGTSSNNRYAAFLRHANRSSKIKNLYFCGGSVHPGGGIPLCLLSAKIVSKLIK